MFVSYAPKFGKWSVLRRRHRSLEVWEIIRENWKFFLAMWAFMQIIFLQDLGKFFKLKYSRWLCIDFLFSSVCMSHRELSDFFFSAICQPIRPSWAGWLIESVLWDHPHTGHCDTAVRDSSVWHDTQGHLLCDMAVQGTHWGTTCFYFGFWICTLITTQ